MNFYFYIFLNFNKKEQSKVTKNLDVKNFRRTAHSFHIVDPSPWPFTTSLGVFLTVSGFVLYMHYYDKGFFFYFFLV